MDSRWLRTGIAFIWLATGLGVLHPHYRAWGEEYLRPLGLPAWIMWPTCASEVLLGLRVLLGQATTWLVVLQIAAIGTFTVVLGVTQPPLLWDPFGVLGKNLPLLAMIGAVWQLDRAGWTPWAWWLLRCGMAVIWFTEGMLPCLLMQSLVLRDLVGSLGLIPEPALFLQVVGVAQMGSAVAVLLLCGRWLFALVACHAAGLVAIIGVVTWYEPMLWFHPFGPLTKNVSILIGTLVVLRRCRTLRDRRSSSFVQ